MSFGIPRLPLAALALASCMPPGEEGLPPLTEAELGCTPVGEEIVETNGMEILLTPADLEPFCGVTTIRGSLIFGTDADLTGWDGLRALGALEVLEGGLWVQVIEESFALPRLRTGSLNLEGPAEVEPPSLPALQTSESLSIEGYSGTWALPALREVGSLHFGGSGITGVSDLGQLTTVSGELSISSSTLQTLPPAPLLTTVDGAIRLTQADNLASLEVLSATRHIVGPLEIIQTGLPSLSDLSSLESVGDGLQGQDSGMSLFGLAIVNNTEITSLAGLDALRTVRGSMLISDNWNLESLDGFAVQTWEATESDVFTLFELGVDDSSGDISALQSLLTAELPVPCDILFYPDLGTGLTEGQMLQIFERCQGG